VKEARLVGEGIVIAGEDAIVSESIGRHIEGKGLQLDGNGTCRFGARTGLAIHRSQKQGVPRCDHTALLLYDYAIEHFGLWVLKCLPKLVVLPLLADPETRIVVSAELPEKFVTLMMDLGVERERIVFHNPSGVTEFRRLVVPPKIYTFGSSCLPNPFEAFRYDQTPPARSPMGLGATPNRRIYVTRLGNERRRLINEHEVEGLFAESGFQIVEPSKLTGAETLSLFANCEIVAGAFGSGLYNLLFSRRASKALVLVPPRLKFEKQFLTMGHVCTGKGARVGYVFGRLESEQPPGVREFDYSWTVDLGRLREILARFV
jgi:capsular polysaccharide biosynthesis protein